MITNFTELKTKIEDLIDGNHHEAAIMAVAKYYGYIVIGKMIKSLMEMHKIRGHMTGGMMAVRDEIKKEMYDFLDYGFASEDRKEEVAELKKLV